MRLENLTPAHVRQAVSLYLSEAWPLDATGTPRITERDLEGATSMTELLGLFERKDDGASQSKCFTLRLGNSRYPFMKFVMQEYLVNGEYFFSVDTHDEMVLRPDAPDHAEWERLKIWNRDLKDRIEAAWSKERLPTHADLRELMEELARIERAEGQRARLLLVDDDTEVAMGLKALLEARGYAVDLAHDGRQALSRMRRGVVPDLVLLDRDMPEMGGEEVLERMRADETLKDVLVLMATASDIDLARLSQLSGFLRKPYPRHVLFAMISRLLEERGHE
jgi:CheY-like chemotaxis protein